MTAFTLDLAETFNATDTVYVVVFARIKTKLIPREYFYTRFHDKV